jgi:hypothetical protein
MEEIPWGLELACEGVLWVEEAEEGILSLPEQAGGKKQVAGRVGCGCGCPWVGSFCVSSFCL